MSITLDRYIGHAVAVGYNEIVAILLDFDGTMLHLLHTDITLPVSEYEIFEPIWELGYIRLATKKELDNALLIDRRYPNEPPSNLYG